MSLVRSSHGARQTLQEFQRGFTAMRRLIRVANQCCGRADSTRNQTLGSAAPQRAPGTARPGTSRSHGMTGQVIAVGCRQDTLRCCGDWVLNSTCQASRRGWTARPLYSVGYGGRVRPPIVDSHLDPLKDPGSGCQRNRVSSNFETHHGITPLLSQTAAGRQPGHIPWQSAVQLR